MDIRRKRRLQVMIVFFVLATLVSSCAPKRPVVKPNVPQQTGFVGVPGQGEVLEGEMGVIQARLKTIYFDYDKFTLTPQAQADLQYDAEVLKRAPDVKIIVEGHCDERGTDEYNLALGERRARSVMGFLTSLGVDPSRMSAVSYGSELPADPGHNEAAWAKNRRVYLRVSP